VTQGGLPERLITFIAALREHGVAIGPAESVDAAMAMTVLGLADRQQLRYGLSAALLRRSGHQDVFDALFDLYFPSTVGVPEGAGAPGDSDPIADLRALVADALAAGDDALLERLAAIAVERLGSYVMQPGTGSRSAYETLERLRPQTLIAGVEARLLAGAPQETFTARLIRDELRARVEAFRAMVATEARRRSAELRGRERIARVAVPATADQSDFLVANREQLAELRRAVQPLSRRLASRLAARRRRSRHGVIDLRRTLRKSLSTGGIPLTPAYKRPRPGRPEIVMLCDVSGSVAGFAHFTLMLVEALHDQFNRVRAFAFVDGTAEVTHLVADNEADPAGLTRRILSETGVVQWYGHSDYGSALRDFVDHHLDAVGQRTSVLILGDARTNGGDTNLPALHRIVDTARQVHWLNPEPMMSWATGDSAADDYRSLVEMHECRNAQQLTQVIGRLLPV
jgi:uncharacterized protein with von Willebrand factor type A (vWA) domain